ncbi:hypothetical protein QWY85_07550 [Neolewinella lacunae]|uniref:Sulfotransferase family protein n=1 Tax=Neolewinella lacunae TaxID=1517758 RepID=A0A923T935_9BACT|nr:hypothetical protein [Neolewinella lacunae]MBC6994633.1 hypothetical protein [Neolewinella lacunae]MDN3634505.1 hypothetical protein [Neolewinella lacunae]
MNQLYPVYTAVANPPETVCQELSSEVFDYPFFNDGARVCKTTNRATHTLQPATVPAEEEQLALNGLIFHISHCGSTLLGRLLQQMDRVRVVSETEAINGLLLSKALHGIDDEVIIEKLRAIAGLYRQKSDGKAHVVFKLTSWNVYFLPLFQRAFPGVPWVFLDREDKALTASLLQASGGFMDWLNHPVDVVRKHFLSPGSVVRSVEEYLANMIAGHRFHASSNKNEDGRYGEYPAFLEDYPAIITHFGLSPTAQEANAMKDALRYDAKSLEKILWQDVQANEWR